MRTSCRGFTEVVLQVFIYDVVFQVNSEKKMCHKNFILTIFPKNLVANSFFIKTKDKNQTFSKLVVL